MWVYILKRLLLMIPTLFGVLLLTFVVIQFVPGGPVEQYLAEARTAGGTSAEGGSVYRGAQGVDPKRLEQIKALYGFDKPAHERFVQMLGQFARFDLGTSFFQNKAVSTLIIDFDNTAPQVYIQSPPPISSKPWEAQIRVRGALMPGWTAASSGVDLPVDKQRRFNGTVDKPEGTTTLAIRLAHPQRGVHYYLRRGK